jgi:hypothetical protein
LSWSLAHHERFGDTDIFPTPYEYEAIRHQWSWLLPQLLEQELSEWRTGPFRRALTPKSRFGFRTATQLDPLDSIVFAGLVYDIAKDLESYRLDATGKVAFSHRVRRDRDGGQLYDPRWNFDRFKAHLQERCSADPSGWVVVTDVADFYSRIYHHPLENSLRVATNRHEHVDALMRLLSQWNYTVSSGVPIGPAASRILAEVALVDVDRALQDDGIEFARFSDDYRLFASTERQAHSHLATLAQALAENHLTLSERKTDILKAERFTARRLAGERPDDAASLAGRVAEILERYGYENDVYSTAELGELPPEMVAELDALNLNKVLEGTAGESRLYDGFIVSLALRRLAQLQDSSLANLVADNLHLFTPVLPQTMNYFRRVVPADQREAMGKRLLNAIDAGPTGHQEYLLSWLLDLFATDAKWVSATALQQILGKSSSVVVRPRALEVLGSRNVPHWFRQRRRDVQNLNEWELRGFIRGARCLSQDEYRPWLKSLLPRLGLLGQAVTRSHMP